MDGLSDARNVGIDNAKGKYICFIDSDDYIESTYIEELYNAIKKNNAKMAQCNISKVNDNKKVIEKIGYQNEEIKTGIEVIEDMYKNQPIANVVVWNKMYEKSLFNNLRYPVGKIHEDEFVTYKILYSIDKIAIINRFLYNYRKNEKSIMNRKFNIKGLDKLEALEERLNFFTMHKEEKLYKLTLENYIFDIRNFYIRTKKDIENSTTIQNILKNKYKKNSKIYLENYKCNILNKININLFNILPFLYEVKFNYQKWINDKKHS